MSNTTNNMTSNTMTTTNTISAMSNRLNDVANELEVLTETVKDQKEKTGLMMQDSTLNVLSKIEEDCKATS